MKFLKDIGRFGLLTVTVFIVVSNANAAPSPSPKIIAFWNDSESSSGLQPDHSAWQALLEKYVIVNPGSGVNRFDYDRVSEEDELSLRAYLFYLQNLDPRQLNRLAQKAYWLNIYNASVVLIVIAQKPDSTIRTVDSRKVWQKDRFNIVRQNLSLDTIEHGILRPIFTDERIHFGLHKATLGGANIVPQAFTESNVELLLEEARQNFLNHERSIDFRGNNLVLSRMFKWYEDDFGGNSAQVKNYLKRHVSPETAEKIDQTQKVRYQYDWSLNKP